MGQKSEQKGNYNLTQTNKIYELIGADWIPQPSFYTIALPETTQEMLDAAEFGKKFTPFFKIKLNRDASRGVSILSTLFETQKEVLQLKLPNGTVRKWSIDANAAWDPEFSIEFAKLLVKHNFQDHFFMLEQPFPLEFSKVKV